MEPDIKGLSKRSRTAFFWTLLLVFLIALPAFIFYSSGYRLSFDDDNTTIVTTGGIYITTENLDVDVYLDEERVERPRLFRSAYYIQNIENGLHRLVVQKPGLHTWVKLIPVDSYIVTEASAFNLPEFPYIRPIAPLRTAAGVGVYFSNATTTDYFPNATTTGNFIISNRMNRTSLVRSDEFEFVEALFASSSATSTSLINRLEEEIGDRFRFATSTSGGVATTTITYVEQGNMRLVPRGDELFARWIGSNGSTPYYFCTPQVSSSTIALRLGEHFAAQVEEQRLSTTTPLHIENNRLCRTEVRLDRKWQKIKYYEFFPNSSDLVVLQLEDGLYVTEVDDRAWQNTQLIYKGDNFETVVTDTNIYIKQNERYFELLTVIPEPN